MGRLRLSAKKLNAVASVVLVDVVADRSLSLRIADELQVAHESPQIIILKDGEVVHTASHMGISPSTILSHL